MKKFIIVVLTFLAVALIAIASEANEELLRSQGYTVESVK